MYDQLFHSIRAHISEDAWVPLYKQFLDDQLILDAAALSVGGELSTRGKLRLEFEDSLAKQCGFEKALALNSGTSALQLGLRLNGVESGDLVLCPSLTYVACANAILYLGAEPVFIDVEEDLPLFSLGKAKSWLESNCAVHDGECFHIRTKKRISSLLLVHLLGEIPDLPSFYQLSEDWKIPILEDQAQGIGSKIQFPNTSRRVVLSFNGNKLIKAGGGGALLSNDSDYISSGRHLASTAREKGSVYRYDDVGYNYLMPAWNAALALVQLDGLSDLVEEKLDRRENWRAFLPGLGLKLLESKYGVPNAWVNGVVVPENDQAEFKAQASNYKVELGRIWAPLHESKPYSSFMRGDLSNTTRFSKTCFLLP